MKKHKCHGGFAFDGTGFNGEWCEECGCLYFTDNGKTYKLLHKPLGANPLKCTHSVCFGKHDFVDAVLIRTDGVKYCALCGTMEVPDDNFRKAQQGVTHIHHPFFHSDVDDYVHLLSDKRAEKKKSYYSI